MFCLSCCFFSDLHQFLKSLGVVHYHIGQHLTVQLHAGLLEAVHECGVGQLVLSGRGVDPGDPEATEGAFLLLPVPIGVLPTLLNGVLRRPVEILAAAEVSLGHLENLFLPLVASGR